MELPHLEEDKHSEIQRKVMDYLAGQVKSTRDFEDKTGISHAMYGRYKDMKSSMTLDKLEKIFSNFPEVKLIVADYLGVFTEEIQEKGTAATKDNDAAVYRDRLVDFMYETITKLRADNSQLLNIIELALRGGSNGAK